jgi:hypothetical protein
MGTLLGLMGIGERRTIPDKRTGTFNVTDAVVKSHQKKVRLRMCKRQSVL